MAQQKETGLIIDKITYGSDGKIINKKRILFDEAIQDYNMYKGSSLGYDIVLTSTGFDLYKWKDLDDNIDSHLEYRYNFVPHTAFKRK